ncbi:MAG: acyltransferase family protein [Bacilli bacterium]|nr:acyltransferase family protein [Bacilli bacterium]
MRQNTIYLCDNKASDKQLTERNSNIELLRIISMIMIIMSHYNVHNKINTFSLPLGFNRYILEITILGDIGVTIFVLITGYFSIDSSKPFKIKKLFLLVSQVLFYSLTIYTLFIILGIESFSTKQFIKNLFPISFEMYWFMSVYIILYIFIPYINKFLQACQRKDHLIFILISLFIFSFLSTLNTNRYYANELIQFIMFYSIGAYLKRYQNNIFKNQKTNKIIFISTTVFLLLSVFLFDLTGLKYTFISRKSTYFFRRPKIISILFSISLFNIF